MILGIGLIACVSAGWFQDAPATQQVQPAGNAASAFSIERLEQIAAPIALYPDSLLTQVCMAATYPLEVVEAARWVAANPGQKGAELESALKAENWDPSVKSLCGFPEVLKRMNDNLDWTQDLGDAFLGQKSELLDAVQHMRQKAYDAGQLKTTQEQTVTMQEDQIIVVQPANPQVIYVPTYSPAVVYGGWSCPTWYYPALYVPPPPGAMAFSFAAGVAWGAAVWGHCDWGWGHSNVNINVNHYNNFVKNTNIDASRNLIQNTSGGTADWKHDPEHRGGVNYRDSATANAFGADRGSAGVSPAQARGYGSFGGGGWGAADAGFGQGSGSNLGDRGGGFGGGDFGGGGFGGAFGGSRNASFDSAASMRGNMSRWGGGGMGGGMRGGWRR